MIQGLIADDDAAIRAVVADAIGQQGRGLLQAGSNAELAELLRVQTPDIIPRKGVQLIP
jgi:CheY-like chemotaxis protein